VDWERRRALLSEVAAGAAPRAETRKLWLIVRALDLRARRPQAFAGGYEPLEAGEGACAFVRGGDVLCAVATRERWDEAALAAPAGRWRDVINGGERELGGTVALPDILDDHGLALFERVG
jgi:(1->4)-alpha-D-glucan 1-alpha-D-glucosylmutase